MVNSLSFHRAVLSSTPSLGGLTSQVGNFQSEKITFLKASPVKRLAFPAMGTVMFLGQNHSKLESQTVLSRLAERNGTSVQHLSPMIALLPEVLSEKNSKELIELARQLIESDRIPSGLLQTSEGRVIKSRSSQLARARMSGAKIDSILNGLGNTLGISARNMEPMVQVLCYQESDEMAYHSDELKPSKKQGGKAIKNQRVLSLVASLDSKLKKGGSTEFKDDQINQGKSLNIQLPPRHALLFESYLNHRGASVVEGEKWVLVVWIRQKALS